MNEHANANSSEGLKMKWSHPTPTSSTQEATDSLCKFLIVKYDMRTEKCTEQNCQCDK